MDTTIAIELIDDLRKASIRILTNCSIGVRRNCSRVRFSSRVCVISQLGCGVAQQGALQLSKGRCSSPRCGVAHQGAAQLIRVRRSSARCGGIHQGAAQLSIGCGEAYLAVRRLAVRLIYIFITCEPLYVFPNHGQKLLPDHPLHANCHAPSLWFGMFKTHDSSFACPCRRENTMSSVLMAIVVVFLCCHSPRIVVNFYEAFQVN